ncbi:MAG: LEA type 2 family protein [Methanomicrobiales archaeon]|nr:LEA type 2 family protein [Methanomicrobiales archaeon]
MKKGYLPQIVGLLLLLTIFLTCSGCISVQNPEITVQKISITNVSLQKMTWRADIQIYNPNSMEVQVSGIDITVSYKDGNAIKKIGNGTYETITIPAKSSEQISIPVIVENADIISTVLTFLKTGEMMLITTGTGHYNMMFIENAFSFSHEMSLSLDTIESTVKNTIEDLLRTAQGTKTTIERVENLSSSIQEGVGKIIDVFTNDSPKI